MPFRDSEHSFAIYELGIYPNRAINIHNRSYFNQRFNDNILEYSPRFEKVNYWS